ncbi:MAG: DNA alkylation repair protein [Bacteroidaceae bacterium]|nr:DNA alkylation repair protein [Bacteroidaceae bacterium]
MDSTTTEKLQLIKRDFRSLMNGTAAASLREKGLHYRLIFGVEWPQLMRLSAEIGKDHDLAQALWKEDIRECRLLAGLIQPVETFSLELADVWIETMHYPEEAQYTVLSLFQHLPHVSEAAFNWIARSEEMYRLCGWLVLARLFMKGLPLNTRSEDEFIDQAETSLQDPSLAVRVAARNAVLKYSLIGEREEQRVGKIIGLCNF